MIYSGELPPDDWLPPLRELADHLGISVLTLRVALRSLVSEGFIVTSRGAHGGSRVGDIQSLTGVWIEWMRNTGDEVDDLWEFREIVETSIAALAARRRTNEDLQALERAWDAAAAASHTAFLRWNAVFHDALATASHSSRLAQAMLAVRRELFLPVGLLLRKHRVEELRESHSRILDTVRDRQPEQATEAMREHILSTRLMVSEVLEEAQRAAGAQR
jgi:DNA-binding FadR family transcriptional regulator